MNPTTQCKICGLQSEYFDDAQILRKYSVKYFRCTSCGFVQTEEPYWLDEAYSSAISSLDTGIVFRNICNEAVTTAILNLLYPKARTFLDYGAGHGILVRLMRDRGFNFSWYDLHATNDYARGFEHIENATYDVSVSFEVLEHLADPMAELSTLMSRSENVFVSTILLPQPTPKVADWWYYTPLSGQHISLYTLDSLKMIAQRFGRNLLSHRGYHLFTASPKSKVLFRLATSWRASQLLKNLRRRPSLMLTDLEQLKKLAANSTGTAEADNDSSPV